MFYITHSKEIEDCKKLAELIATDDWIDSDLVLVNCSPDYSSIVAQIVNHKLSYKNSNELFEQLTLEMPYPVMNQIWNSVTKQYELFDSYLKTWVTTNINKSTKYLFLDSGTLRGRNFSKLKQALINKNENHKFATLYLQSDSIFKPDYFIETFDFKKQGGLLFQWENQDNPNWNY